MFLFFFFLYVCFWVYVCVCLKRPEDTPNLLELELQQYVLPNIRAGIQTQDYMTEQQGILTLSSLSGTKWSNKLLWFRTAFDP